MGQLLLQREHFITGKHFSNSSELFKYASDILSEEGYVTNNYYEALVKRESEFPTGIETEVNFALAHAELENVIKSTFMVFVLDEPVVFNNMVNPTEKLDVNVVILLVLKEKSEHLDFLTKVMSIFQKGKEVKEMLSLDSDSQYQFFYKQFVGEE